MRKSVAIYENSNDYWISIVYIIWSSWKYLSVKGKSDLLGLIIRIGYGDINWNLTIGITVSTNVGCHTQDTNFDFDFYGIRTSILGGDGQCDIIFIYVRKCVQRILDCTRAAIIKIPKPIDNWVTSLGRRLICKLYCQVCIIKSECCGALRLHIQTIEHYKHTNG